MGFLTSFLFNRLFIALNDEVFQIRELAIQIIAKLTNHNPAYVLPSLRKKLIEVLLDLEYTSDGYSKEESAKLLAYIISASGRLIHPYVDYILKQILPNLKDPSPRVSTCILKALGELTQVAGKDLAPYMTRLLPILIDTIQDQSSDSKRFAAYRTLGQLIFHSGYVIVPFVKHPRLLDIIVTSINSEKSPPVRQEIVKVLGIIGAVDPYRHKMLTLKARLPQVKEEGGGDKAEYVSMEESKMAEAGAAEEGAGQGEMEGDDEESGLDLRLTSEDYYPTVAIYSLMRIMKDPSLSMHHTSVAQAVMYVFKSLGLKCTAFLPKVMPHFFHVMRTCDLQRRQFLFQQLGVLVSIIKQYIREYLPTILELIHEYWESSLILQVHRKLLSLSYSSLFSCALGLFFFLVFNMII